MGNLPATRVQPARPFLNTGVDFCGPIWTHYKLRGKRPQKSYVAVFCCFATKAVHLEVVSDLTTNGFIGALKRFVGRRGLCQNLYCDNATNFVGANNQLEELNQMLKTQQSQEDISKFCTTKSIQFHFIPPRAPHFGGLWEAAVKSAKLLLQKIIASASLTYEELETVMIEIEAILNSRPITPLSSDPNDLTALTPGHFIIGEPLTAIVDPKSEQLKVTLQQRWTLVKSIKHEFWRRWSREYLCELQQRHKWKLKSPNIKPGIMVVIKEDNLPPLKWQLGRILQPIKGNDGLIRVAEVKTEAGVYRRPIHSLCPLPVETEETKNEHPTSLTACTQPTQPTKAPTSRHPNKGKFLPINSNWLQCSSNTSKDSQEANHTKETAQEEPAKKKPRCQNTSKFGLSLLLLASLVLPVNMEPIEITEFNSQPGLYFENLGSTKFIANEWNLIVFYNMTKYWNELNNIRQGIRKLTSLCHLINTHQYCDAIVSQLEHYKGEISSNNEILLSSQRGTRNRRSPLDIVGTIANKIFGVLDQEYANNMSKIIESVRMNENHLLELLKNQTSLIESTTNIMRKDQETIDRQFQIFDKKLEETFNEIQVIKEENYQGNLSQLFSSFALYVSLIIINYLQIQSALLDVMADTHQGRINPLLLTPNQLRAELTTIRNHIPSTLQLPGHENHPNLLQLYNLMTVQGRITSQHVVFSIRLPLFTREEFELFRLISVPVSINQKFMTIEPSSPFLIANLHRDRYYPITEAELKGCITFAETIHLCKQQHPIYDKDTTSDNCELSLLNHVSIPKSCKLVQVDGKEKWIQLFNPNTWIYSLNQPTTINIVCNAKVFHKVIKGVGLLKFKDNCMIKHSTLTINSHNVYPTQLRSSFLPAANLSNHPLLPQFEGIQKYNQTVIRAKNDDLINLQKEIETLKLRQTLPGSLQPDDIHQYSIGYISLLLIAILIAYVTWNHLRMKAKATATKPVPKPRTSREDFIFNA